MLKIILKLKLNSYIKKSNLPYLPKWKDLSLILSLKRQNNKIKMKLVKESNKRLKRTLNNRLLQMMFALVISMLKSLTTSLKLRQRAYKILMEKRHRMNKIWLVIKQRELKALLTMSKTNLYKLDLLKTSLRLIKDKTSQK